MAFRADVQGLRAVAVVPVLLFHFGFSSVPGGFAGVDVFFVISGFVISLGLIGGIDKDAFSLRDFYARRIRRIFPLLLFTCFLTVFVANLIFLPPDLVLLSKSAVATLLSVSNFFFWRQSGYFAPESQSQPLLHCWSLGVEEQFYLLMPLAMIGASKVCKGRWLAFLASLCVASFAVSVLSAFWAPSSGFFLLPARAWELASGSVLAVLALRSREEQVAPVVREILGLVGLALVLSSFTLLEESLAYPAWNALLPCLGTGLVIWAGSKPEQCQPLSSQLLAWAPFRFVGTISYSLYLVHWPLAAFFTYRTIRGPSVLEGTALFVASLIIATLFHFGIERPMRDRSKVRTNTFAAIISLGAIVLLVTSGYIWRKQGFPERSPDYHTLQQSYALWGGPSCFNEDHAASIAWDPVRCTRVRAGTRRVLLWGDSYAAHYGPGLVNPAAGLKVQLMQYTSAGCPPILADRSLARFACQESNARALSLIRSQRIDEVVLAARWTKVNPRILARLHETVESIRALGVSVVVIGQSPEFSASPDRIDWISGQRGQPVGQWEVSFDRGINKVLATEASGARFIDPIAALCPQGPCPYRLGGAWLFQDFGHFSEAGSRLAVAKYFPSRLVGNTRHR